MYTTCDNDRLGEAIKWSFEGSGMVEDVVTDQDQTPDHGRKIVNRLLREPPSRSEPRNSTTRRTPESVEVVSENSLMAP